MALMNAINFMTAIIEQTEEGGDPFKTTLTVRGNMFNTTSPSTTLWGILALGASASLLLE